MNYLVLILALLTTCFSIIFIYSTNEETARHFAIVADDGDGSDSNNLLYAITEDMIEWTIDVSELSCKILPMIGTALGGYLVSTGGRRTGDHLALAMHSVESEIYRFRSHVGVYSSGCQRQILRNKQNDRRFEHFKVSNISAYVKQTLNRMESCSANVRGREAFIKLMEYKLERAEHDSDRKAVLAVLAEIDAHRTRGQQRLEHLDNLLRKDFSLQSLRERVGPEGRGEAHTDERKRLIDLITGSVTGAPNRQTKKDASVNQPENIELSEEAGYLGDEQHEESDETQAVHRALMDRLKEIDKSVSEAAAIPKHLTSEDLKEMIEQRRKKILIFESRIEEHQYHSTICLQCFKHLKILATTMYAAVRWMNCFRRLDLGPSDVRGASMDDLLSPITIDEYRQFRLEPLIIEYIELARCDITRNSLQMATTKLTRAQRTHTVVKCTVPRYALLPDVAQTLANSGTPCAYCVVIVSLAWVFPEWGHKFVRKRRLLHRRRS